MPKLSSICWDDEISLLCFILTLRIFHPYRPVFGPYSVVSELSHQSLLMHCFVSLRSSCFLLLLHRFLYFHICVQVHVLSQSFGKSCSLPAVRTALLQPTWGLSRRSHCILLNQVTFYLLSTQWLNQMHPSLLQAEMLGRNLAHSDEPQSLN